jgi:hypothetical protein
VARNACRYCALALILLSGSPAFADAQAEYRQLMRAYQEAFRVLGRSRVCRLDFDAGPHFREVAPMPCDVVIYMRGMRLPELPASLRKP